MTDPPHWRSAVGELAFFPCGRSNVFTSNIHPHAGQSATAHSNVPPDKPRAKVNLSLRTVDSAVSQTNSVCTTVQYLDQPPVVSRIQTHNTGLLPPMPGLAPKSMTRQKEEKKQKSFFLLLPSPSSVCLTFHGCAPGVLAHSHPQLSPRVVRFPTKKEKQKTFVETTRPHIFGCAPDTLSRRLLSPTFEINRTHARKYKRQKISRGTQRCSN